MTQRVSYLMKELHYLILRRTRNSKAALARAHDAKRVPIQWHEQTRRTKKSSGGLSLHSTPLRMASLNTCTERRENSMSHAVI